MKNNNVFNIIKIFILVIFILNSNSFNVFASPINDVEINMDIQDGKANINVKGNEIDKIISGKGNVFEEFIIQYRNTIIGFFGIASLTTVIVFVINFIKLAPAAGNPTERRRVIEALLWSGISTAILGGIAIIVGLSYGFLR